MMKIKIINHNSRRDGMNPIRLNWDNDYLLDSFFWNCQW